MQPPHTRLISQCETEYNQSANRLPDIRSRAELTRTNTKQHAEEALATKLVSLEDYRQRQGTPTSSRRPSANTALSRRVRLLITLHKPPEASYSQLLLASSCARARAVAAKPVSKA
jgi:hypothetical protein